MKCLHLIMSAALFCCGTASAADGLRNPQIDYRGYKKIVIDAEARRESNRLTEVQFIRAMRKPGVVLLDARSRGAYLIRHIEGAVNLPYTDFTADTLAAVIPDKRTPILIYCNNNFTGSRAAFPSKMLTASLNLATDTALRAYGYTNIHELGPLLDVNTTAIPFAGTEVERHAQR